MEINKDILMTALCKPGLLNEITVRFNNLDIRPYNFNSNGNIPGVDVRGNLFGVSSTVFGPKKLYYSATTLPEKIIHTCEKIGIWQSEWNSETVIHNCYDAPFDARVYRKACEGYQTVKTSNYIPQTVGIIVGTGAVLKAYQNYKAGNQARAAIWAAISATSIALPLIYSPY